MKSEIPGLVMANFDVRYERSHGIHEFETRDDMPVTGLSYPTWEEFADALEQLPDVQGYIVGPELITSPVPLDLIQAMKDTVESRIEHVRNDSARRAWARTVFGTPQYVEKSLPQNAALAVFAGNIIGKHTKLEPSFSEAGLLGVDLNDHVTEAFDIPQHGAILCSDLMQAAVCSPYPERANELIKPSVKTLIALSCWGVPTTYTVQGTQEEHCRSALESSVGYIFGGYPSIDEIIMVDRAIPGTNMEPFNAHFTRTAA